MKTQIRLLLQEQSDLGLHCLSRLFVRKLWTITVVPVAGLGLTRSENSRTGFLEYGTHMSLVLRKPAFCICKNKYAVTGKLISAFVFATRIVQSLYFLNSKCQASSHLLWLYSLACVGPGQKTLKPVFSQRGSYNSCPFSSNIHLNLFITRFVITQFWI